MADELNCPICNHIAESLLDKRIANISITSDSQYTDRLSPCLCYCRNCRYFFTHQSTDLNRFYESDYILLMQDFLLDQTVVVENVAFGRAQYQARIIGKLVEVTGPSEVLEVGAGKGLTAFWLANAYPELRITLHDPGVSRYEKIWRKIPAVNNCVGTLAEVGSDQFDVEGFADRHRHNSQIHTSVYVYGHALVEIIQRTPATDIGDLEPD